MKKLYKNKKEGKICGVCAGIAEATKIDVTILRIITFLLIWLNGVGLLTYILFAILLPDKKHI